MVGGSNPLAPTNKNRELREIRSSFFLSSVQNVSKPREVRQNGKSRQRRHHNRPNPPGPQRLGANAGHSWQGSLSEVVSYTLEMARAQEENGADTPEAPRQENGREGRIEIPGEDGEWLRAEAKKTGYSETGILVHALRRLKEEFEAGRLAWTAPA